MKILLIGANGQLARDLQAEFTAAGKSYEIIPVTHEQLDIRDQRAVDNLIASTHPECIINTAAFHRVDLCEEEPETTFAVNEGGNATRPNLSLFMENRVLPGSLPYNKTALATSSFVLAGSMG